MKVKSGAQPSPKINPEHDRQIVKMKAGPDCRDPKRLQQNEDRENSDIKFFVLKHNGNEQEGTARKRVRSVAGKPVAGK
jgi:hypothetical protein